MFGFQLQQIKVIGISPGDNMATVRNILNALMDVRLQYRFNREGGLRVPNKPNVVKKVAFGITKLYECIQGNYIFKLSNTP